MFEYTRCLHPDDYPLLEPYVGGLAQFKALRLLPPISAPTGALT